MEPLLTVRDVAKILRIHENDVYALVKYGELSAIRVGKRRLRFSRSELSKWLNYKQEKSHGAQVRK
jgi:excisionase family DNA binding protein